MGAIGNREFDHTTQAPIHWKIETANTNPQIADIFTVHQGSYLSYTKDKDIGIRTQELDNIIEQTLQEYGHSPEGIYDILNSNISLINGHVSKLFNIFEDEDRDEKGDIIIDDENKKLIKIQVYLMSDYYNAIVKSDRTDKPLVMIQVDGGNFSENIQQKIQYMRVPSGSYLSLKSYRTPAIDRYIEETLRGIGFNDEDIIDFIAGSGYFYQREMRKYMMVDEDSDIFDLTATQKLFEREKQSIKNYYIRKAA